MAECALVHISSCGCNLATPPTTMVANTVRLFPGKLATCGGMTGVSLPVFDIVSVQMTAPWCEKIIVKILMMIINIVAKIKTSRGSIFLLPDTIGKLRLLVNPLLVCMGSHSTVSSLSLEATAGVSSIKGGVATSSPDILGCASLSSIVFAIWRSCV